MFRSSTRRLVALNAVLLVALVALVVLTPSPATADPAQPVTVRPRGDYTMVSGKTSQGSVDAVYILDSVNQELVAIRWDTNRRTFQGIGYRNLAEDARLQTTGR